MRLGGNAEFLRKLVAVKAYHDVVVDLDDRNAHLSGHLYHFIAFCLVGRYVKICEGNAFFGHEFLRFLAKVAPRCAVDGYVFHIYYYIMCVKSGAGCETPALLAPRKLPHEHFHFMRDCVSMKLVALGFPTLRCLPPRGNSRFPDPLPSRIRTKGLLALFVRDARIELAPNAWEALVLPLN
jgi:hypothetical protein